MNDLDRINDSRRSEIRAHVATMHLRRFMHNLVGQVCYDCGKTEFHITDCKDGFKCISNQKKEKQP